MQIGKVIRKYRKGKGMTQEEMAVRLGVTAPAVNKWENGNSMPDITLLAPIARLLEVSLDTLLSFREELTEKEVAGIVSGLDAMLKEKPYGEAFRQAKKTLEEYPNCAPLLWQVAALLEARLLRQEIPKAAEYEDAIAAFYLRALEGGEEPFRMKAAHSLAVLSMRKGDYAQAEKYIAFFPAEDAERKRLQAEIYGRTGRGEEACRAYEELLFSEYGTASAALHGLYRLALQEGDRERAHMLAAKQAQLAKCFEMGEYYEASSGLELALLERDTEGALAVMGEMLSSVERIDAFRDAPLYAHMAFRPAEPGLKKEMKATLLESFRNGENFAFLKGEERYRALVGNK